MTHQDWNPVAQSIRVLVLVAAVLAALSSGRRDLLASVAVLLLGTSRLSSSSGSIT